MDFTQFWLLFGVILNAPHTDKKFAAALGYLCIAAALANQIREIL